MTGYVRNDVTDQIANGNTVDAVPLDGEFDALQSAFASVGGHAHNGAVGEGAPITVVGPAQDVVVSANSVTPKTDNTIDLGSSSLEWKDLWVDGTANIDSLVADTADINGGTIDGAVIGGTTPAAVTATNLVATTATIGGAAVTTNTATQTLTNKTINLANNTLVATSSQLADSVSDETGSGALVFASSPALTGVPTAPTAPANTNTTQIATTAHVFAERSNTATLTNKTLTSPTISGGTVSGAAISGGTVSGITDLAIADGGTGASDAAGARTNLGLGTIATQNSNSVTITGGNITGITDLAIADGGTGASTAAQALLNLGITATAAELNHVDGVTSPIQTQLDGKQPSLGFTPVEQGGGSFMVGNKARIGWDAGLDAFRLQVDAIPLGGIVTNRSADAAVANCKLYAPGNAPLYTGRAWVNFNGIGGVSPRAGENISSIVRNSTGSYTINWATVMPDANYCVMATSNQIGIVITSVLPGSVSVLTTLGSGNAADAGEVHVAIIR